MKVRAVHALPLLICLALAFSLVLAAQDVPSQPNSTVRLWITVLQKSQPITDLKKEELLLWIGNQKQSISNLTFSPPESLRIGLLIDFSGSRQATWPGLEVKLATAFLHRIVQPGDQLFVAKFSEPFDLEVAPTDDLAAVDLGMERVAALRPYGGSAIYDALYSACSLKDAGARTTRALVTITDGQDNSSTQHLQTVIQIAQRTGNQLYFVTPVCDPKENFIRSRSPIARGALKRLHKAAQETGGRVFEVSRYSEMERDFNFIATILRAQYALDFPISVAETGKKRPSIKIKCTRPGVEIVAQESY